MSSRKGWIAAAVVLAALVVVALAAWRAAVAGLESAVLQALGPRATVDTVVVGWGGVELRGLRVAAEGGRWPAADELRATRVQVVPDLGSAWRALTGGGAWGVRRISVEGGYLSMLRERDGRMRMLPALLERAQVKPAAEGSAAPPPLRIERVELTGTVVEMFDASVRRPAHRIRLSALDGHAGPFVLPALASPVAVDLRATLEGPRRAGTITLAGELTPATRDARLKAQARSVDLLALQPYLVKAADTSVRRGTLDLDLEATVQAQQLRAPGRLTITGLELSEGGGPLGTFAGVPRQAVLAAMSRDGRISVAFVVEGRLDDPKFSLDDTLALRVAAGMAETLGISLKGAAEGVGQVIRGLLGR